MTLTSRNAVDSNTIPRLPLTAHQQIAKYELPLPRPSALVQPGRPPAEEPRPPEVKRPFLEPNTRPILCPLTESLCKCALQPWQCSHSGSTPTWRRRCIDLLIAASCSRGFSETPGGNVSIPVLALELSPLDIRHAEDQRLVVQRSPYHRPTPSAYRTAWSVAYLHLINHVIHHNSNNPNGVQLHPAERLRNFFSQVGPSDPRFTVDPRLMEACKVIFPRGVESSISVFNPRRAVVFAIDSRQAAEGEARPRFHCIAGWARWSALLATLEGIRLKGQAVSVTHQKALEARVSVYVIDSSQLRPSNIAALALALNLMDADVSSGLDPLQHFLMTNNLTDIRSRPPTLCDRVWQLHQIIVEVDSLADTDFYADSARMDDSSQPPSEPEPRPLVGTIYDYINTAPDWVEFGHWLDVEATTLQDSPWSAHPLVVNTEKKPIHLGGYAEAIIAFMLSLSWPISYIQADELTLAQMRSLLGKDFPFGPLDLHHKVRSGVGLWDSLFLHHLPYQIQCIFSMADLMGFVRTFEVFFVPRSKAHIQRLRHVNWLAADQVSLLVHFSKSDSASMFACRILANDNLRTMASQVQPIAFESLSSFICTYNLQHCLELEDAWLRSEEQGTRDAAEPAGSLRDIPNMASGLYGVGAARVLHTIRAIAVMAYLTCDNPAQLQELARLQQPETRQAPLPLPVPHPARPILNAFALLPRTPHEARSRLESEFELLIGMLAELIFRELLAGLGKDDSFGLVSDTSGSAIQALQQRAIRQEGQSPKSAFLLETLNAGALLIQVYLRECMAGGPRSFKTVALFPGSTEVDGVSLNQLVRVPLTDVLGARLKVYELITKHLATMKLDCTALSHHHFVWRVLEPLQRSTIAEAGRQSERILCGEAVRQVLQPPRPASFPSPPIMALSAPTIEPKDEIDVAMPEVLKSRGVTHTEYLSHICQRRFNVVAQQLTSETRLDADLRNIIGRDGRQSPTKAGAETQVRISKWFDERKQEGRSLLSNLYRMSQSDASITVRADFRKMTPDEARQHAGPLTDLAADSTHIVASLQDIPYQLQVEDPSVLPFAEAALKAVRRAIEDTLRTHLTDGLKQLMQVTEPGHSVVASSRPAVICALWQTLVRLSPFLDVLHPLALRWNELRAALCAWLWRGLRKKLDHYWTSICREKLGKTDSLPNLRWSMRCLPSDQDPGALSQLPDLTAERLHSLLLGPRLLDRICSAFYRFQCSGITNAKAALGSAIESQTLTADRLPKIFSSSEMSLRDLFLDLWVKVRPDMLVEDALHDPEIAVAGYLKRYAPYVLNGLDDLDRNAEVADLGGEPSVKRRRRDGLEDEETFVDRGGRGGRRQLPSRLGEFPAAVAMGSLAIQDLRKDLKQRGATRRGGEDADHDGEIQENPDWLKSLPLTLRHRLERNIPSDEIYENFDRVYFEMREQLKNSQEDTPPSPLPQEAVPPQSRRRRHGRFIANDFRAGPLLPENDLAINGSFPSLPSWMESTPAWQLWKQPLKRPEGLSSPWSLVRDADYAGETEAKYLPLSSHFSHSEAHPEVSDRDWTLVQSVLEFLCRRGIDTLYSSRSDSMFRLAMTEGGTTRVLGGQEWGRELDEAAETPGRLPTNFQGRLMGSRGLRRYLNGWSAIEQCFGHDPLDHASLVRGDFIQDVQTLEKSIV